jgi:CPA1 family monovalent cation:H+ antiporter
MILNIITILSILFISIKLEKIYKIPSPLLIIVLTLSISTYYQDFLSFTTFELFAEEMLSFVVLLVLVDAFVLKWKDLKKNWLSLVYLAVISVVLSIGSGILLTNTLFSEYNLSLGAVIVLFAMVLATDPVSVVSTFKQYPKLPHKVKFLAEGESLFNDAIALIAFLAFGIYLLQGNIVTLEYTVAISIKMIGLSIIVGLIIGFFGLMLMKTTKDVMGELVLILLIAYSSFEIAELFHVSGLLAEIVAILFLTTTIEYSYRENVIEAEEIKENGSSTYNLVSKKTFKKLFSNITNIKRQDNILSFLTVMALFINALLFMSLAKIIDFGNILHFWKETIAIFIMTTLIRMIMMGKFAFFSSKTNKMEHIDVKSYFILVFAGIKGGLSIVMLNMLHHFVPEFEHFDMFVAIVSGVILLSMFFYVIGLTITIKLNKKSFEDEYELEKLTNH